MQTHVINTTISDHYGQLYNISDFKSLNPPETKHRKRVVKDSNIDALNSLLSDESWSSLHEYSSVDDKFDRFNNIFTHYLNIACPFKMFKADNKKSNPWITKGILVSRSKLKFFNEIRRT